MTYHFYQWTLNQLYAFCERLEQLGYNRTDKNESGEYVFVKDERTILIRLTDWGYWVKRVA